MVLDTASFTKYVTRGFCSLVMGSAVPALMSYDCKCAACISNSLLEQRQGVNFDGLRKDEEFQDSIQFMLCPPRVIGYLLTKRLWAELDISTGNFLNKADPEKGQKSFDALQLQKYDKNLIKSLVQGHSKFAKTGVQDFVANKGQGLVILLHGPPGVGKTLTAETVAELAGKPLLTVTIADVGNKADEVEKNLQDIFDLAARWKAVLLFDEADVFLESRSSTRTDLERSSYVSVLLRALEYYEGILVLTTNRIQQFDIAVQSRVSLGIQYKDLERSQKKEIFKYFIFEMDEDLVGDREGLLDWFDCNEDAEGYFKDLNGRQIRSILFSAMTLAMNDRQPMTVEHVSKMARSMSKFQASIHSMVELGRGFSEVGIKRA